MQQQKCSLNLYRDFLIGNHNRYSGAELARVSPVGGMHHDAVSRWLADSSFTPSGLWQTVKHLVVRHTGYLIGDDTLLDKRYSRQNEIAKVQYSGNEHRVLNGINLVNLLWTDGEQFVPVDYRVYYKPNDGRTKNVHFRDMLDRAKQRDFTPLFVLMDTWYASVKNLKHIRAKQWSFICSLQKNRQVAVAKAAVLPIADLDLANKQVRRVWLPGFGTVLVCALIDKAGDRTYLATNDLSLTNYPMFINHWLHRWKIEEFHRGIKQTTGIEQCYSTQATSQQTHIFAAFLAFLKLESRRIREHISWYEQKALISRSATINYLANA
jgi:hypothetical protein